MRDASLMVVIMHQSIHTVTNHTPWAQGDNDPVDVVEIGSQQLETGGIYRVKALGAYAMVDDGELDWKIICVRTEDPVAAKLNDIEDVERYVALEDPRRGQMNPGARLLSKIREPLGSQAESIVNVERYVPRPRSQTSKSRRPQNTLQALLSVFEKVLGLTLSIAAARAKYRSASIGSRPTIA